MNSPALTALLQNAALLLAMVVVFDLVTSQQPLTGKPLRQTLVGAILGILGIGLIVTSFRLETGIVFDTRSVLLGVSGLFLGAIPTVVAMALTAAFRLWQGGAAAWTGVAVILASGGIGIAWRHYRRRPLANIPAWELYAFGVVVHVVMLALMLSLPWESAKRVLTAIGLPVLLVYPAATAALGLLLANRLRRETAATALAEREALLRMAGSMARFGGWSADLVKQQVTWSEQVAAIHDMPAGYSPTLPEGIGFYAPEWRQKIQEALGTCARDGTSFDEEMEIHTAHGKRVWVRALGEAIRDESGKITRVQGAFQDITERKQSEESLRRSEEHYRSTVSALNEGVMVFDAKGGVLACNPSAERILGLTLFQMREQKGTLTDWQVVREDMTPFPHEQLPIARALATGQSQRDVVFGHIQSNVPLTWLLVNAEPVLDPATGRLATVVVSFTDITALKQAETALRESEERLRLATDSALMGTWERDLKTNRLRWSPVAERLNGYEPGTFPGTDEAFRELLHPNCLAAYAAAQRRVREEDGVFHAELHFRLRDGRERWGLVHGQLICDPQGQPERIVGIDMDITERKQAETKLAEQLQELQRWHKATLGRESRILELKREVNELLLKSNQPVRYPSASGSNNENAVTDAASAVPGAATVAPGIVSAVSGGCHPPQRTG
jgi:PAS domain S-box-containing protein